MQKFCADTWYHRIPFVVGYYYFFFCRRQIAWRMYDRLPAGA